MEIGERVHVRPLAGKVVRDPDHGGQPLPKGGAQVTWSTFWHRRREDGDIDVFGESPAEVPPKAEGKDAAKKRT